MNIEKLFDFLVTDYGLKYKEQTFYNSYGSTWIVQTHSFYNDSGCFTIHLRCQIQEYEFYCSSKFATNLEGLCERKVDISIIKPEIWNKHSKNWIFNCPIPRWGDKKKINVFAEALKVHLSENKEFFGIKVRKS